MSSSRFKASVARCSSPALLDFRVQSVSPTAAEAMVERAAKLAYAAAASLAYYSQAY